MIAPAYSLRKILCECGLLLLLAAAPALLAGWLHPQRPVWSWTKPGVAEVDLGDVTRWSPLVLWVDARKTAAFQSEHIPGAIVLNEDEWNAQLPGFLEHWQPDAKVIVYCDSAACDASQAVALRLKRELNLTEVHVLKGGWTAWRNSRP